MDKFVMEGKVRDSSDKGSRSARSLRASGQMPVNVYGSGQANSMLAVDSTAFYQALENSHRLFQIDCDGHSELGLIKEVQYDTFGDHTIHADLARVKMDDVVETTLHIQTIGIAKGTSAGGTLDIAYHHMPVRGKLSDLTNKMVVNIENIAADESIRVRDLDLPDGVESTLPAETPIIMVHGRRGG